MCSEKLLFGLTMYDLMICIGIAVCIMTFDKLADRISLRGKLQNLALYNAVISILLGFGAATLMQSIYNWIESGVFEWRGMTFYGGLIGGAGTFIAIYFIAGHFLFPDGYHKRNFFKMANCAVSSIVVAHAFGRLGCLCAGCCHGKQTDAWYGIAMNGGVKYVPVQLFEAIFLFLLFAFLVWRVISKKSYNLPIYMIAYGVWRYIIEFARGDERGETIIKIFTPSQLIAVIMVVGGIFLFLFEQYYEEKHAAEIEADVALVAEKRRNDADSEISEEMPDTCESDEEEADIDRVDTDTDTEGIEADEKEEE